MKLLKTLSPLLVCLLFTAFSSFGQHKGHAHPHHNTKAKPHAKAHAVKHHHHVYRKAVHRSKYHPATSVVFTPTWAPHKKYNRRY